MKRRLFKLVVFVLLGAILNVAVAWGCGWRSNLQADAVCYGTATRNRSRADIQPIHAWHVPGKGVEKLHVFTSEWSDFGSHYQPLEDIWPAWVSYADLPFSRPADGEVDVDVFAQGWPLLALWCASRDYNIVTGGIFLGRDMIPGTFLSVEHVLAFRPIWPGFSVNTIIYAVILWLVIAAPFTARRHLRVRRNLCPHCAYPTGTSDVCTECGGSVRVKEVGAEA
jgi:hypothetical protein